MNTTMMIGTWGSVLGLAFLAGFIKFWSLCADAPVAHPSYDTQPSFDGEGPAEDTLTSLA